MSFTVIFNFFCADVSFAKPLSPLSLYVSFRVHLTHYIQYGMTPPPLSKSVLFRMCPTSKGGTGFLDVTLQLVRN